MTQPANEEVVSSKLIAHIQSGLPDLQLVQHKGKVVQIIGLVIESQGPRAAIGEICRLESANNPEGIAAEAVSYTHLTLPTILLV